MKEAYVIVYAFQKLEYVLRDMHFTLRTDHKNFLYINEDGSAKVRRWKLAIQEYNFDIEHIAGEENVAADAFSRLCERHLDLGAAILNNFDGPIPAYQAHD